jgi:hypothetical protein
MLRWNTNSDVKALYYSDEDVQEQHVNAQCHTKGEYLVFGVTP